jgi:hypothetical protein
MKKNIEKIYQRRFKDDLEFRDRMRKVLCKHYFQLPKFLPYTTKSRLPRFLFLVKIYLKLPILYKIFGGQAFIVVSK